jgi:hypothetical protein
VFKHSCSLTFSSLIAFVGDAANLIRVGETEEVMDMKKDASPCT